MFWKDWEPEDKLDMFIWLGLIGGGIYAAYKLGGTFWLIGGLIGGFVFLINFVFANIEGLTNKDD